ncbi:MAG: arylsulfatase [Armatimonadota bacterium]|nr:arylsulfatase [Armatimonadota bacterium]
MTCKPNIIWIMADDLSWGDLGCYGQKLISTPNIDRLAEEGMRFTSCYSGSTVCAPSRSCLMQGLHSGHASVRDNMVRFEGGFYRPCLTEQDTTVAQVVREVGYATGVFGKWGLSVPGQPGLPNSKGFDEFFGYLNQRHAHSYYPPFLYHNYEKIEIPDNFGHDHLKPNEYDESGRIIPNGCAGPNPKYSFDLYAEKSLEFVRRNADRPFFLYLAYTIPHGVHEVPELGRYKDEPWPLVHRIYAAMVTRMDAAIGDLLNLLTELGLDQNTLIFFTTDNGYSAGGAAKDPSLDDVFHHRGPFKGEKGNLYQGGVRVPAIAWWPGRIKAGAVSTHPWAFWDFLPTAAELAGARIPEPCDGISILPTLFGCESDQREHDYFYWEFGNQQAARLGCWWAYRPNPRSSIEIYHAEDDPAHERDLSSEKPDVVRQAERVFQEAHVPNPQSPSPGETYEHWIQRCREAGVELVNNVDW